MNVLKMRVEELNMHVFARWMTADEFMMETVEDDGYRRFLLWCCGWWDNECEWVEC